MLKKMFFIAAMALSLSFSTVSAQVEHGAFAGFDSQGNPLTVGINDDDTFVMTIHIGPDSENILIVGAFSAWDNGTGKATIFYDIFVNNELRGSNRTGYFETFIDDIGDVEVEVDIDAPPGLPNPHPPSDVYEIYAIQFA